MINFDGLYNMGAAIWVLSSSLVGLTALIIIFVFVKYGFKKVHFIWAWFNIIVAIWGFGSVLGGLARNNDKAIWFWKFALFGGMLVPVCFYHVIAVFGELRRKLVVSAFYFYGLSFYLLTVFDYVSLKVVYIYSGFYYIASVDYRWKLFILGWLAIIVWGASELFILIEHSSGYKKSQFQYLFAGYIIGMMGAVVDALPFFDITAFPIGNFLVWIYCMTVTYAMFRRQLMDIEVIIKKTIVFAGLLTSVLAILILPTLIIQEYLLRSASTGGKLLGLSISSAIIIFTMRKIESLLINITDKFLFQKKYSYKELLNAFSTEVLSILNLDKLLVTTAEKLKAIMKLDSAEVLLVGGEVSPGKPYSLNKAEVDIPIMEKDKKIGAILLGKKKSDEPYTQEDMDILFPLAHALAIAISNARLFEKLSAAKAEAAQKEKMASIGTLAAGMAHEIRNPITTIRTFADYLPERYRDRGFMDTFNRLIPGEIDRVERITGSLLEFSHSEDTAIKETVDIPGIVNIILSLLKPQYRFSGVEIISDFRGDGRVVANKGQIRDAIFNIVKYMLSEMPRNSVLKIEVTGTDNEVTAAIGTPDMAIEEYIIKDVLEPVSSLYRERRGFGFDIFVARQLIEGAGGDFRISSDGSIGTQFRIRFDKTSARPS